MSACTNKVSFHIERGFDYKEVKGACGRTDPYGNRAVCSECRSNPKTMKDIENNEANAAADNAWQRSANWGEM